MSSSPSVKLDTAENRIWNRGGRSGAICLCIRPVSRPFPRCPRDCHRRLKEGKEYTDFSRSRWQAADFRPATEAGACLSVALDCLCCRLFVFKPLESGHDKAARPFQCSNFSPLFQTASISEDSRLVLCQKGQTWSSGTCCLAVNSRAQRGGVSFGRVLAIGFSPGQLTGVLEVFGCRRVRGCEGKLSLPC